MRAVFGGRGMALGLALLVSGMVIMGGCGEEVQDVRGTGEAVREIYVLEVIQEPHYQVVNLDEEAGRRLKEWIEQNVLARRDAMEAIPPAQGEPLFRLVVTDEVSNVDEIAVFPGYLVMGGALRLSPAQQGELVRLVSAAAPVPPGE